MTSEPHPTITATRAAHSEPHPGPAGVSGPTVATTSTSGTATAHVGDRYGDRAHRPNIVSGLAVFDQLGEHGGSSRETADQPTATRCTVSRRCEAGSAHRLYDADMHAARQSHVDAWISAASAKLHLTLAEYLATTDGEHT